MSAFAESATEKKTGGVLRYASHSTVSTPGYTPECTNNASLVYLTVAYESLTYYDEAGNIIPSWPPRGPPTPRSPASLGRSARA
jgi:hypothetical protein